MRVGVLGQRDPASFIHEQLHRDEFWIIHLVNSPLKSLALSHYRNGILLTEYSLGRILRLVAWEVEFTDEFSEWWGSLTENQQDDVAYSVGLLAELGPALGFPHSSKIIGSRHSGMRELRTQSSGRPLRTLYAFDPLRVAILLVGGDKTGADRWYETFVALADRIYDEHLRELRKKDKL